MTQSATRTLVDRYLLPEEVFQDMFARVSETYADDEAHAQRLYDYMSKLWFMPATPVLSNGGAERGLPISCLPFLKARSAEAQPQFILIFIILKLKSFLKSVSHLAILTVNRLTCITASISPMNSWKLYATAQNLVCVVPRRMKLSKLCLRVK